MTKRHLAPFYAYSSFNRRGGKMHPTVIRRMNQALDMYAVLIPIETIAESLEISPDTVRHYIKRGKRRGDPRCDRPRGIDRRTVRARTRRTQIELLAKAGFSTQEIASRLDVHVRLVQIRLKECG